MAVSGIPESVLASDGPCSAESLPDEIAKRIYALANLGENWNGLEADSPNPHALDHAVIWIKDGYKAIIEARRHWSSPHVVADEEGNVVFEWWKGHKKLTVYVSPSDVSYLKVSGPRLIEDMMDGSLLSTGDWLDAWTWLSE